MKIRNLLLWCWGNPTTDYSKEDAQDHHKFISLAGVLHVTVNSQIRQYRYDKTLKHHILKDIL